MIMTGEFENLNHVGVKDHDYELAREVIEINLTLAGLRECVMVVAQDGIVFDMQFCEPGELDELKDQVANDQAVNIAANNDHKLQVVEAPIDRLHFVRGNLLTSLGSTSLLG